VEKFVDRLVLVHIQDGRAFRGTFICVDNDLNIILVNTDELTASDDEKRYSERNVGMVVVPGKHLVKIEVQ
ncbi:hypothetical protein IE53DRAFT_302854, partial [Violaceomyces palustris]